jgi:hypothetical protein
VVATGPVAVRVRAGVVSVHWRDKRPRGAGAETLGGRVPG